MTSYKVLKKLPFSPVRFDQEVLEHRGKTANNGQGLTLELKKDEAEPEGSDKGYMSELVATGEDGADVFYVPPHWHKVRCNASDRDRKRLKFVMCSITQSV